MSKARPPATPSSSYPSNHPLVVAEKRILALDATSHNDFVEAIFWSLWVDLDNTPPRPSSPKNLADGLSLDSLYNTKIVIAGEDVAAFLAPAGIVHKTSTIKRKHLTEEGYANIFSRKRSRCGRPYVFTYAEVLHLVGRLKYMPEFPPRLFPLLAKKHQEAWNDRKATARGDT